MYSDQVARLECLKNKKFNQIIIMHCSLLRNGKMYIELREKKWAYAIDFSNKGLDFDLSLHPYPYFV